MTEFHADKVAFTLLRVVLGGAFLLHGLDKQPLAADATVQMFMMWGMPAPSFTAFLAIGLELVGGALLIAGVWVRPVSLILAAEMVVALWTVHWDAGFSFMQVQSITEAGPLFSMPGWEVNILYIAGFVSLALSAAPALARQPHLTGAPETGSQAVPG